MSRSAFKCVLSIAVIFMVFAASPGAMATPLDDYVAAPDGAYTWNLLNTYPHAGYTDYVFHMASQNWLTLAEVDRTLWEHYMVITVPDVVSHETGILYISSGNSSNAEPTSNDSMLVQMALDTQTVTAWLRQVPNQPLTFAGDPFGPRSEDEQIAYCWRKFLDTGESKWLSRLPMTKSAVRALDTVTAFMGSATGGARTVDKFVVTGASKRGWTTWTTAAVDSRVVAFAPMVIDLLNMQVSFRHHFDALGFWSPQIVDYTNEGITEEFTSPEMKALTDIVEPYSYLDRYVNKPKFVMNGSQDEFFLPDSSQFYWERLTGEKRLRYVPNAGHGLNAGAISDLRAWYWSIINDVPRPDVTWTKMHDGSLEIHVSGGTPSQVLLWETATVSERSFSLEFQPPLYTSSVLAPSGTDTYTASVAAPPSGWKAFLVEFTFPSGGPTPFRFTTEISIVPDVLPYGPRYALGAETEMLDAAFYEGEASDGSNVAGRMAFIGTPSNDATRAVFWGVNAATQHSAFFVADIGDPSSWRRIMTDYPTQPHARACWVPDDSAILVGPYRIAIPAPGQLSGLETIINHGYNYN
ncbi:MAG: PhoPQ-activated protein PqaA family protein, partial [Candidatus Hydrogenedentales bacterium]